MKRTRRPRKEWHAVVTRKSDVIVVKIAEQLRQCDTWYERRELVRRAFAFIGESRPKEWES